MAKTVKDLLVEGTTTVRLSPAEAGIDTEPRKAASRPVKAIRGRSRQGPLVMPRKGGRLAPPLRWLGCPNGRKSSSKMSATTIMRVAVGRIS
jgi:hypothetical protein